MPANPQPLMVQEIARLNDAAMSIAREVSLDQVLHRIPAAARELVGAEYAALRAPAANGGLDFFLQNGMSAEQVAQISHEPIGAGLLEAIITERRVIRVPCIAEDSRSVGFPTGHPPMTSFLGVPLTVDDWVLGSLYLTNKIGADEFSATDAYLVEMLASHAALAIEHARLFEVERQRARQITAIVEASQQITATLDLQRILKLVINKAAETLPMDAGALFQYDAESQAYWVAASYNLSADQVSRITFAFKEGVPGWVAQHRQVLIIPDATTDSRVHPNIVEQGIQSVLAIPLLAYERVVGVLNLYSKTEKDAFGPATVGLTQVFAAQAAISIENARLVDELRRGAAELELRVEERTQQLRETQAQVIRTEKLAVVGRLAASVAHEVNNPLQSIALHLQLIADEGLTTVAGEEMAIVQEELARITSIVQRLLDYQRPQRGRRTLINLADLMDDVLKLTGEKLQESNVAVIRKDAADLAPILAVGNQLKQVFLNVILNAVEAMPTGGELRIRIQQEDRMIMVALADTGRGMTETTMEQLFEPFFSTKPQGTGLGLAVSHEIVAQHGGEMFVNSAPGHGSTFGVKLPIYLPT